MVTPSRPTDDSVAPTALQFPWHLIPFLVIIFLIIVVLITYYLHIPDVIYAIILAIKEKRRQMKASKPNTNLDLTKGNFSTEGFKASPFHSHQREMSVCEEPLNYAIFETAAMKAIEFSVFLDEEGQSSGSEESLEISCEMEEEIIDQKQGYDTLSEMFDSGDTDNVRADTRRNRIMCLHDSPASYDI
ncbi:hypothetical protein OS493_028624 [Desmophyllum pertusum]|uniref:Uncharacterized protein n=1 Tax=Desmophyllum pertusum TaxID=174260 RepID=A0A9W9YX61_9CNID|nr:hypothetical protein OS493_028624 [Desmophyllum pertusum]